MVMALDGWPSEPWVRCPGHARRAGKLEGCLVFKEGGAKAPATDIKMSRCQHRRERGRAFFGVTLTDSRRG